MMKIIGLDFSKLSGESQVLKMNPFPNRDFPLTFLFYYYASVSCYLLEVVKFFSDFHLSSFFYFFELFFYG